MDGNASEVFASSSGGLSGQYRHHQMINAPDDDVRSTSPQSSSSDTQSTEARLTHWHSQFGISSPLFSSPSSSPASTLDLDYVFDIYDDSNEQVFFEDEIVDLLTEEEICKRAKKQFLSDWSVLCKAENSFIPSIISSNDKPQNFDDNINHIVDTIYDLFEGHQTAKSSQNNNVAVKEEEEDEKDTLLCKPEQAELPELNFDIEPVLSSLSSTAKVVASSTATKSSSDCDNGTSPALTEYLNTILISSDEEDANESISAINFKTPFRVPPPTASTSRHLFNLPKKSQWEFKDFHERFNERQNAKREIAEMIEEKKPKKARAPRKRARRQINAIISNGDLTRATREAKRAERSKRSRLTEKKRIFDEEGLGELHPNRIILDFDLKKLEILAEVDPNFAPLLKPHQIDGVKFLFNSVVESVDRLEMVNKEEKDHSFGGILAHCMGLGKTFQVIVFIQSVLTNPKLNHKLKRILLLLPLNVIKNWEAEFHNWFQRCGLKRTFELFELYSVTDATQRALRLERWHNSGGVLLITPKLFSQLIIYDSKLSKTEKKEVFNSCLLDPGPDIVIVDEGHCLKNVKSDLNKTISQIRTLRRIILTGTPMQNNLSEYWTMVSFVKPNLLGSKKEFDNQFANPINNGQYADSTEADVRLMKKRFFILHKFLEYSTIHRRSYAILEPELPPRYEFVLECKLTGKQKKLYEYYLQNYVFGDVLGEESAKKNLFLHYNILGYIWNHPALLPIYFTQSGNKILKSEEKKQDSDSDDEDGKKKKRTDLESIATIIGTWDPDILPKLEDVNELKFSAKFLILFEIIEQCQRIGDKILVFSQSLLTLDLIEGFLKSRTLEHSNDEQMNRWQKGKDYFRLDGAVNADERAAIIEIFNNPKNPRARLILISTRAGGVGINLVGANRAVIFDSSWNPANDVQAIYRIFRYGQTKPVYVYRFAAHGTMESKIYKRQIQKQSVSLRVVDEFQVERHFKDKVLRELYDLAEDEQDENRDSLVPPMEDKMLWNVFLHHRDMLASYHHHNSLLENLPAERLSSEEEREAWNEYLLAVDAAANSNQPQPNLNNMNGNMNMQNLYGSNWNNTNNSFHYGFTQRMGNYSDQFPYRVNPTNTMPNILNGNNTNYLQGYQKAQGMQQPFGSYNSNLISSPNLTFGGNTNTASSILESSFFQAPPTGQPTLGNYTPFVQSTYEEPMLPRRNISDVPTLSNCGALNHLNSPKQMQKHIASERVQLNKLYSKYEQKLADFIAFKDFCEPSDCDRMQRELTHLYNEYEQKKKNCDIVEQFHQQATASRQLASKSEPPINSSLTSSAFNGNATIAAANSITSSSSTMNHHRPKTENNFDDESIIFLN